MTTRWNKDRETTLTEVEHPAPARPEGAKLDDKVVAYLLSYPKSGNTWLRYIIEYFVGIPTIYEGHMARGIPEPTLESLSTYIASPHHTIKGRLFADGSMRLDPVPAQDSNVFYNISAYAFGEIGTLSDPHIDYPVSAQPQVTWRKERMCYDKGLILKKHFARDIAPGGPLDPSLNLESKLLFLIRDPRDAIVRHTIPGWSADRDRRASPGWSAFAENVRYFNNYAGDKLVVYYEELLQSPRKNILEVVAFLGTAKDTGETIDKFIKYYSEHVDLSAKIYRSYGSGAAHYQTTTLNAPNFGINAHYSNHKKPALLDAELAKICEDPGIADVLSPYIDGTFKKEA